MTEITETVYRERGSGKKRDVAKEKKQSEEENQRKKLKEEQYNKWGKGLVVAFDSILKTTPSIFLLFDLFHVKSKRAKTFWPSDRC